jgi:hypothetical protein
LRVSLERRENRTKREQKEERIWKQGRRKLREIPGQEIQDSGVVEQGLSPTYSVTFNRSPPHTSGKDTYLKSFGQMK